MKPSVLWPVVSLLLAFSTATLAQAESQRITSLPIMEGATDFSQMKRRGDVRFDVGTDFKSAGEFYSKALAAQGWSKPGKDNLQRDFWVQEFSKNSMKLVVRTSRQGAGCNVRLTPTGMVWEEDDQPTPDDLPIPVGAAGLKYNDFSESISYQIPGTVGDVAADLSANLEKKQWKKVDTDFDFEHFVRFRFAQKKSTLEIDIREEGTDSEVNIRTNGMQWDTVKARMEQAERKQEEAEEQEAERERLAKIASPPSRMDKLKQGIANMPKLPNLATVEMDGTSFELPHVIAYEVFEYDEWTTKIVATQKPVKQASLLARLKRTGTDKDEDDAGPQWPEPYMEVVIEEDDAISRMNFRASGTPGHGSRDDLQGTALVEDGRARGTVALREPGSFFEKVYTGKISFDVPVLTRNATPTRRLMNAPQLANEGKLRIGEKTYQLTSVVAYPMYLFDEPMTAVVLSEWPLDLNKLEMSVGRKAADEYFEFIPQIKLLIDAEDNLQSLSIWADNISISSNKDVQDDVVIEDGRARGTVSLTEAGDNFGESYTFQASFDVTVLGAEAAEKRVPVEGLAADTHDGLPVPEANDGMQSEGSLYRSQSSTTVDAKLNDVVDFYRQQLTSGNWGKWSEDSKRSSVAPTQAELNFSGDEVDLTVSLRAMGASTAVELISRKTADAKSDGLWPEPTKARLVIVNTAEAQSTLTINKRQYTIAAEAGAYDPKTALNWTVAPGRYVVSIGSDANEARAEKLNIAPGETWGVIIRPDGDCMPMQLY